MLIAFVIWVTCMIATPVVASARGMNGCIWAIVGFFFGFFGLLFACIWPSPKPQLVQVIGSGLPSQPALSAGPTRLCPACLSDIPAAATVCRYCQRESAPHP